MSPPKLAAIDLPLGERDATESKQEWIYRVIRGRILDQSLQPLTRLPSSRDLAKSWHVSRGVVEVAYQRLADEDYVTTAVGIGTLITDSHPDSFWSAKPPSAAGAPLPPAADGSSVHETASARAFVGRIADPALFPMERWRQIMSDCLRRIDAATLLDDDPAGFLPLRRQIAAYLGSARGLRCDPECVVVVTGIRHAVDLVARTLAPGAEVLIEDPGYDGAYAMFAAAGARLIPVPADDQGMDISRAPVHAAPALVYVTPAHQSPTGHTLSTQRRSDLLSWARQHGAWILEDDYDSEINYEGAPLLALKGADVEDRVIHCGSFNKTLFSSLRIGYMVVPRQLLPVIRRIRALTGRANGIVDQIALTAFIQQGHFAAHLRKVRLVFKRRRDLAIGTFRRLLGDRIRITGANAGFHFLLWLPEGVSEHSLREQAGLQGILLHCLSDYTHAALPGQAGQAGSAVLIGFSAVEDDALVAAAEALARLILLQSRALPASE